jgi:hypothetical protein
MALTVLPRPEIDADGRVVLLSEIESTLLLFTDLRTVCLLCQRPRCSMSIQEASCMQTHRSFSRLQTNYHHLSLIARPLTQRCLIVRNICPQKMSGIAPEYAAFFPPSTHPNIPRYASSVLSTLRSSTGNRGTANELRPEQRAALAGISAILACERSVPAFSSLTSRVFELTSLCLELYFLSTDTAPKTSPSNTPVNARRPLGRSFNRLSLNAGRSSLRAGRLLANLGRSRVLGLLQGAVTASYQAVHPELQVHLTERAGSRTRSYPPLIKERKRSDR